MSAIHICTWNVSAGAKHTYGTPTPSPDYENTRCILLWGANPRATFPTAAQRISRARARGAKLIVIDPRRNNLARSADCWLRVRPGSDAALALAMIHVLIEEKLFDEAFIRDWTTGPFLVRDDTERLLTARLTLTSSCSTKSLVVWDNSRGTTASYHSGQGYFANSDVQPALGGRFSCRARLRRFSGHADRPSRCLPGGPRNTRLNARSRSPGSKPKMFGGQRDCSPPNCRPATSPGPGSKCTATPCRPTARCAASMP